MKSVALDGLVKGPLELQARTGVADVVAPVFRGERWEPACKPGSVEDRHSSGTPVTRRLKQPTRVRCGQHHGTPIWPCSGRGLPCHALLPGARCALTAPFHPYLWAGLTNPIGGVFSVALSVGSRRPGITWRPALWSPDFPPRVRAATIQPTPASSFTRTGHPKQAMGAIIRGIGFTIGYEASSSARA